MFELQPSCIVLAIGIDHAIILMKQDDNDTDGEEISADNIEDSGESTLSSDIEVDNLDDPHEVLHLDQARHEKITQTTRVRLRKKWIRADTVIARTLLPNLRHPAGAIAPPLLNRQISTINIFLAFDIVPASALPLPTAPGDRSVSQSKAGGDHNILQHQKTTFEVGKWFMAAIVCTKTH
jgi:hypothetical protein